MPYDGGDLYVKVEVYINGAFVEVTTRARGGRAASGVQIDRGRGTGALQAEASICRLTLGNADGHATEGNPESPWFPYFGRGCRIRVSISDVAVSDAVRFDGEIDTIVAVYPGGSDSSVRITATGTLGGQLSHGSDPLNSALRRSTTGVSASGIVPHECWPMEDGEQATLFASALSGGRPMAVRTGAVTATDSTLPGSLALPLLTEAANVSAGGAVRTYTDEGMWVAQFVAKVGAGGGPAFNTLLTATTSTTTARYVQVGVNAGDLILQIYSVDGTSAGGYTEPYDTARVHEQWVSFVLTSVNDSSGTTDLMSVSMYDTNGELIATISELVGVGYHSNVARLDLNGLPTVGGGVGEAHYGHLAFYIDPAWTSGVDDVYNARAAGGWSGEYASDRIQRLCDEEGLPVTITGTSDLAMGPQSVATLLDLLIECEAVDNGLLSDGADDGLTYRCLSSICNQDAALAVTAGSLDTDVAPMWDNRNVRNDVTVSRPNGSSARLTDEAHIARTRRRIKDPATANVESDEQLPDQAGWRINQGTAAGPRYNGVGINMRDRSATALADAVLALNEGDRFTVAAAALPAQHPPGGIDSLVVGWREELDKDKWVFAPQCVPYDPFVVAVWDDPATAKFDTAGSLLHTAVSETATTFDVATTSGPLWTPDNAEDGWDWYIGGERVTVTDVAASTVTYGAVGTVSHANNASVTPGLPGSLAQGNLMVMLAAIRNSGAGVPNTPSGWTRWAVFEAASNVQVFAKIAGSSESGPTVTFTGGVANADTTAQIIRLAGKWHSADFALLAKASALNASAQDIAYPGLSKPEADNCIIIYVGWKQDDWTSVASPGTEIAEPDTTTGDDQGIVWAYQIQTSRTFIAPGSFVVTGGAAAISRGAVMAIRCDYQTATVTRSVNGVVKSHSADEPLRLWTPMRWALGRPT